jgi:hypothetical protein
MKKEYIQLGLTIIFSILLLLVSCNKENSRQDEKIPADNTDSVSMDSDDIENKDLSEDKQTDKTDTLPAEIEHNIEIVPINTSRNSVAQFLAGKKQGVRNEITKYQDSSVWKGYSKQIGSKWSGLEKSRISAYNQFRDRELNEINNRTNTLFYPFGGPDFLHAAVFFPNADVYVLIGLEKVGSLPGVQNMEGDSAMIKYFNNLKGSINTVLSISFFITKDMKIDFKEMELDGILPILLIFCVRTGHEVADIKGARIDESGNIATFATEQFQRTTGVEITLKGDGGKFKKLYYFSKNLADVSFKPNTGFYTFVKKLGTFTTYLKAASYLMHNDQEFSNISSVILNQSRYVIQDDSGIPLRLFNPKTWELFFYGYYDKPINLFSNKLQPDLAQVYQDSTRVRNLGFGIGYQHHKGKSNMMIAKRK